ncbi:MAG: uracil-DNA glycosylase [Hoeflea sp.]|uniref:uracil-DNA glycosylase n=1 Tax=Hoeflea sp. TaxID=1940281 RepID=UPI003EFA9C23
MATTAHEMDTAELAALLQFYAESGLVDLCEDAPTDRFQQSAEILQARAKPQPRTNVAAPVANGQKPALDQPASSSSIGRKAAAQPIAPAPQASQLTIPGAAAFSDARGLAASANSIAELRSALEGFTGCNLRHSAKTMVFADGNPEADVMFIGEAPGREEDLQGTPFVGRAGQLLDRMLAAIGLSRDTAYITNIIPWRPPGNRTPAAHEIELCRPFVERHIALANPMIVIMLGNIASKALLDTDKGILSLRGTWMECKVGESATPAMPTLHPAYLLRNPAQKRLAWADFLALQDRLEHLKIS